MHDPSAIQTHLLQYITRNCDVAPDIESGTDLIASAAIDSLLVADLTVEIESTYGITLSVRDISPENFRTVEQLSKLVATKQAKQRDAA